MLSPARDRACGPSFSGHLDIEAAAGPGGRTVLARQSFRAPYHLTKSYWDGRVLQVRIVNSTAGILAGDRLDFAAKAAAGAALLVMTPAATRAFTMRTGGAVCRQTFTVEDGAWLEYAAEPLFPHEGSDYDQATLIQAAEGAELYYADALAPGRAGRGETWAWRRLRLALTVEVPAGNAGECILRERFAGTGSDLGRMAAVFSMPEAWIGTVVVMSPRLAPDDPAWNPIRSLHGGGRWVGVTRLRRGGWIVRIAAPGALSLREALAAVRASLASRLPFLTSDLRRL
jgi:urease accessory protein